MLIGGKLVGAPPSGEGTSDAEGAIDGKVVGEASATGAGVVGTIGIGGVGTDGATGLVTLYPPGGSK